MTQSREERRKTAIAQAKATEASTDEAPQYVVWSVPDDDWIIQDKMPMGGEWYTSDGIRHG